MQQVEQGKLDLDADVNHYLDFKIPPRDGKPITLRNIMTHTPGFEEQIKDLIAIDQKQVRSARRRSLKRWVPKRIFDAGHDAGLFELRDRARRLHRRARLGRAVRRLYRAAHLRAAGHDALDLPPAAAASLKPLWPRAISRARTSPTATSIVGPAPAGSLAATGDDMGRFMIAHLKNGAWPLLQPADRAADALDRATTPIPRPAEAWRSASTKPNINGHRVDLRMAATPVAFHSDLHLFLDDGVGLFVSFNSAGKEGAAHALRSALFEQFADRYFPAPADNAQASTPRPRASNAEMLAGTWSTSRRSDLELHQHHRPASARPRSASTRTASRSSPAPATA